MKKIMFSMMAVSVLLLSCSKNNDHTGSNPVPSVKGKRLVFSDANYPTTFTYNANGTLNSYSYDAWGYSYKYTYTYNGDSVRFVCKDIATGKPTEMGAYGFTAGKVSGFCWWTCNADGEPVWNYQEKITYNAKGLVDKHTFQGGSYNLHYYDANGNLEKRDYFDMQGTLTSTCTYAYYDKEDKFPWYGALDVWCESFIVAPLSKHLVKKIVYTDFVNPADSRESSFTYEFDADGYVIKGTDQSIKGQQTTTTEWHNTYQ